jgi:hypothetical protein
MVRPRGRVQRRPELLHVGSGGRGRHGAGGSGCRVFGEGSRSSSPRRPIKKLRIIRVFYQVNVFDGLITHDQIPVFIRTVRQ